MRQLAYTLAQTGACSGLPVKIRRTPIYDDYARVHELSNYKSVDLVFDVSRSDRAPRDRIRRVASS
jgi:hypothetical protein